VLVAKVLKRLQVPGAWLAAAVFALHPVHVESVAWVTERKNILSAFFYLLAMLHLLNSWNIPGLSAASGAASSTERRNSREHYLLGVALFVAALLSKSVTCSLPAVLLLILCQRQGGLTRRDVLCLAPMFAIGLAFALNTAWLEQTHVGASGAGFQWTFAERVLIAGRALWFYAGKLVWPVNLAFIYPRWSLDVTSPAAWCVALSAALAPLILAVRGRGLTAPLVAVLFFGGTLLPALGFFNIYPMRYSFVADHFQYLASLGLISLIAALAVGARPIVPSALSGSPPKGGFAPARLGALVIVLGGLACLTWQRQSVFRDSRSLWKDTLARNPTSMAAHFNLGRIASQAHDYVAAERHFRACLLLRTDELETSEFETNLAVALAGQQRFPEAAAVFESALARVPDSFEALNGLGNIAARQEEFERAISLYRRALDNRPGAVLVRLNLGTVLSQAGQLEAAEREIRRAAEDDPAFAPAHFMLAQVLALQGRFADAEAPAREAVRLDPDSEPASELLEQIRRDLRQNARPSQASETKARE
jgi:tetratricopeptide (TPR) repeat protein